MENVVIAIFKVESEAYQAFSEVKRNSNNNEYLITQIALVKKSGGKIVTCDGYDSGITTTDDTRRDSLIGMLIGLIAGPLGMLLGASTGALIGSSQDAKDARQSATMIELVSEGLEEGETAMIMLARENREDILNWNLSKFNTEIYRRDAKIVADEADAAIALQKELKKEAKQKMRESKKAERKAGFDSFVSKFTDENKDSGNDSEA